MSLKAEILLTVEVRLLSLQEISSSCSPAFFLCCFSVGVTQPLLGLDLPLSGLGRSVISPLLPWVVSRVKTPWTVRHLLGMRCLEAGPFPCSASNSLRDLGDLGHFFHLSGR